MNLSKLTTPDRLLQSVATITEQRSREMLESALLTTFIELMPLRHISLYQFVSDDKDDEAILVSQGEAGSAANIIRYGSRHKIAQHMEFRTVMETGREFVQSLPDKSGFEHVYPVRGLHGITGFLQVISGLHTEAERRVVYALLGIYSNYLSLLLESETDTLTGLLNRRTFDQNIGRIVAERTAPDQALDSTGKPHPARRKGGAEDEDRHWLAIIDIDHFKQVNDQYGHLYGDEVLLLLARTMRTVFRQKDKLFRFGGEEFVVVLDRTSLENAYEVLERFRKTIENYDFPQIGRVTVSIGFVCLGVDEVSSDIIGHADQALYYAKHNGRNQVCQYEELLSTGRLSIQQYSEDMQLF